MTADETLFHVATIMASAHHLGIGIRETSSGGSFAFEWRDSFNGVLITGPDRLDRKEALVAACDRLADSWQIKIDPTQAQYKI